MAGRDSGRLADLNEAFRDPVVRAVITTRGGAGAYRIADDIDFDAVTYARARVGKCTRELSSLSR
jgi:muramoyltetrapeptide carboxypeptidase